MSEAPERETSKHWIVYTERGGEETFGDAIFNPADAEAAARDAKIEDPRRTVILYEARSVAELPTPRLDPLYQWFPPTPPPPPPSPEPMDHYAVAREDRDVV